MEEKKINVIKINVDTEEAERKLDKLIELAKTAQESVSLVETNERSIKEILRQQLNILAERSQNCLDEMLPALTGSMVQIANHLEGYFAEEDIK